MNKYFATLAITSAFFIGCSSSSNGKIHPQVNFQEKILGKWISVEEDGVQNTTNKKGVYTLNEDGKGSFSTAFGDYAWHDGTDFNYKIDSN
ncbi:MAG: hypothetical protein VZR14_10200, partial [Hallerella sp.]|nr:hypothetical protein [Hallerella sp.]